MLPYLRRRRSWWFLMVSKLWTILVTIIMMLLSTLSAFLFSFSVMLAMVVILLRQIYDVLVLFISMG